MKNNPFIDLPSRSTLTGSGTSSINWSAVSKRRDGRKKNYGRVRGGGCTEETLFPLQPRRDLSGGTRWQRC